MGLTYALARRRGPWATAGFLVAPAVVLTLAYQGNVAASGTMAGHHHHTGPSVADLTGPKDGPPDVRVTLTAAHGKVKLASGREIDALTSRDRSEVFEAASTAT
ncbi:hypothetical protein AB0K40_10075 [Nonomuraea bangladeshensis]|uniref:Uncharacterized protein n=1 Tax=Nonomuraea bangladeshensis TaxID=404385 RepID=A0ABV3GZW8_9ACTN